jgi:hypothetical protein
MDSATKELWQKVIHELEYLNRTLNSFLKLTHRPRQNGVPTQDNEHETTEQDGHHDIGVTIPQPHFGPRPQASHQPQNKWYHPRYWWGRQLTWWKPRFEVIAVFFAIGYAVVTYFQWRDQARNFKQSQRPWVGAYFKSPVFKVEQGSPIVYSFAIHNFGQSPALNAQTKHQIEVIPNKNDGNSAEWNKTQQVMDNIDTTAQPDNQTIFNGQDVPVIGTSYPVFWPEVGPKQAEAIQNETLILALFGKVTYSDIFGDAHVSTFCVVYKAHNFDPSLQNGWKGCPIKTTAN